mgnify:CR=1 FL=1
MKYIITILLALFISSNANADIYTPSFITKYGEVIASGVRENGNMIMIMKYKDGDLNTRLWRCIVYYKDAYTTCKKVTYD